jgi:hypothetical protein
MKNPYLTTALFTLLAFAASLSPLSANLITAGQTVSPDVFTTAASSPGYTLLASTGSQTVNPSPGASFDATYTEYVYEDASNIFCSDCLDFFLAVSNAGPGTLERISTADFGSFLTDVGYNTSGVSGGPAAVPSGIVPATVDLSATGGVIGFNFEPAGTPVAPGQSSVLLEVETNAKNYMAGTVSVQDGYAGFAAGFVPSSATPEPMSLALLGSGLLVIGFVRRRTRKKV